MTRKAPHSLLLPFPKPRTNSHLCLIKLKLPFDSPSEQVRGQSGVTQPGTNKCSLASTSIHISLLPSFLPWLTLRSLLLLQGIKSLDNSECDFLIATITYAGSWVWPSLALKLLRHYSEVSSHTKENNEREHRNWWISEGLGRIQGPTKQPSRNVICVIQQEYKFIKWTPYRIKRLSLA